MKIWQAPSSTVNSAVNATCCDLIEFDYVLAPSTSTVMPGWTKRLPHRQRLTATDQRKDARTDASQYTPGQCLWESISNKHTASTRLLCEAGVSQHSASHNASQQCAHTASVPLALGARSWPTTSFAAARSSAFSLSASSDHLTAAPIDSSPACSCNKCSFDRRCCSTAFLYRMESSSSSFE